MSVLGEPTTAAQTPVDLSRRPDRASSAAEGLSPREAALFHGYRHPAPVEVSRDCACGGVIRAVHRDHASITEAIRCHQELTIHRLWRVREGIA